MEAEPLTKKPERSAYWDVAKCLLILLVVLGHLIQHGGWTQDENFYQDVLFRIIYMFHMPMFALICGFFAAKSLKSRGFKAVPRYAVHLLLPSVTYAVLSFLMGHKSGGLWFLVAMFECTVVYYAVMLIPNRAGRVVAAFLPFPLVAGCYMAHIEKFFPVIQYFIWLWPFFAVGGVMAAYSFTERHIKPYWGAAMLLLAAAEPFFDADWFVYRTPFRADAVAVQATLCRTLAAVVGCIGFMGLCRCLIGVARVPLVLKIGQATLGIYLLQSLFFNLHAYHVGRITQCSADVVSLLLVFPLLLVLYGIYALTCRIPVVKLLLYGKQNFFK